MSEVKMLPIRPKPDILEWLSVRFKIDPEDILWYHGGTCYDRVLVRSQEAADKVTAAVKCDAVNGGWFHGMCLGRQDKTELADGTTAWDVMC